MPHSPTMQLPKLACAARPHISYTLLAPPLPRPPALKLMYTAQRR